MFRAIWYSADSQLIIEQHSPGHQPMSWSHWKWLTSQRSNWLTFIYWSSVVDHQLIFPQKYTLDCFLRDLLPLPNPITLYADVDRIMRYRLWSLSVFELFIDIEMTNLIPNNFFLSEDEIYQCRNGNNWLSNWYFSIYLLFIESCIQKTNLEALCSVLS